MGRFKADRAGYAALMNSAPVQSMVERKAHAVKAAADAALSEGGYELEGHEVKDFDGVLARGRVVRTKTDQARYSEAKRKTLSRALDSARGYRMDVEATVARRLAQAAGVPGYLEAPKEMPDSFITVEQIGGGGSMFEPCRLAVDCWAKKKERKKARAIAESVAAAVADLDEEANFFHPEVTNLYRQNDPDTGRSRYIVQIQIWVCE